MASAGNQTTLGKAFEFACLTEFYHKYSAFQVVDVAQTEPLATGRKCFSSEPDLQANFLAAAKAAVRIIDRLEPRLQFAEEGKHLLLSLQPDSAGVKGDVRDVLCVRDYQDWEIGLSCKHNHHAVKHSRLSANIDFGKEWFGYPCSKQYFSEINPIFSELAEIRSESTASGSPALWADIEDKNERVYVPILQAFMDELNRLAGLHPDVPELLIHYLLGKNDFYKVITDDFNRVTRIEAININGTLNKPFKEHKAITTVPLLKMPTKFYHVGFKEDSKKGSGKTTIMVACDNGWEISMRIHNASSKVEPSLKFDVNMVSFPSNIYVQTEPWDFA